MDTVTSYGGGESGSGHPCDLLPLPRLLSTTCVYSQPGSPQDGQVTGEQEREGRSEHESVTSGEMSRWKVRLVREGGVGKTGKPTGGGGGGEVRSISEVKLSLEVKAGGR